MAILSGKKMLQAVTLFACVGEVCGRYKLLFSQAMESKKPLPNAEVVMPDGNAYMKGLLVEVVGEPGKAVCRLTFTSTGDLTVEEVVELARQCYYTNGRMIDAKVENNVLWVQFFAVPKKVVESYEAMLKTA
ncbi:MAG TPA: hypothetical protein VFO38_01500 [Candidatus Saccharimonadales bacterium]|nr:hypothetical protein [Candidatus Saccharimonadales bacterium]